MINVKVSRKNTKAFDKLVKKIAQINNGKPRVLVGLLGGQKPRKETDSLSNPEIGAVMEYGAPDVGIPARPWLGPGVTKNSKAYVDFIGAALGKELEGASALNSALNAVGAKAAADVRNYVTQGPEIQPTNSDRVKARKEAKKRKGSKGSTRTLVDTAQMINGVTWRVEKGSK